MDPQRFHRIILAGAIVWAGAIRGFTAESTALGSIQQLEKMNLQIRKMSSVPENVTEDYISQVQTVANLHDPRAIPALMGAIETGDLAMQGLASLGDPALLPVISVTKESNAARVYAALQTLSLMLEPDNMKNFKSPPGVKEKMKRALLPLQSSEDPILVRDVQEIIEKLDEDSPLQLDPTERPSTQNP